MAEPMVINTDDIDRMIRQVKALENIDFSPLMEEWRDILQYDNENNLGIDAYGIPMQEVTYRPDDRVKEVNYQHIPPFDNLHSSHYRILTGPPLSPRDSDSRVTQRFRTRWEKDYPKEGEWTTIAGWEDFKSLDGLDILPFHAAGEEHNPNLPVRDLLNIRPSAIAKARDALVKFINRLLGRQT